MAAEGPNTVPEKRPSSYKKGFDFEQAFREVMRTQMGFVTVDQRKQRKGQNTARGWECDLIGAKGSRLFLIAEIIGLVMLCVALVVLLDAYLGEPNANVLEIKRFIENAVNGVAPGLVAYIWVVMAVLAAIIGHIGERLNRVQVMVECRNTRDKVKRTYINEVRGKAEDVREQSRRHAPDEVWVVSSSGFDQDALTLATAKKIHCIHYQPQTGTADLVNGDLSSRAFTRVQGLPPVKP